MSWCSIRHHAPHGVIQLIFSSISAILQEQRNCSPQSVNWQRRGKRRAGRKNRNSYRSLILSKSELGVLVGSHSSFNNKVRSKRICSAYFVFLFSLVRKDNHVQLISEDCSRIERSLSAPIMAILVNRRHPGTDSNTWEHSDAHCFLFHFKIHCWEFSLHNTLDDKCLEEWILKEDSMNLRGCEQTWEESNIWRLKLNVSRVWRERVRGAAEKKENRSRPPESTSPLLDSGWSWGPLPTCTPAKIH